MKNPFEKPHSREEYDQQQSRVEEAREVAKKNPGRNEAWAVPSDSYESDGRHDRWIMSNSEKQYNRAKEKLQRMKEKGHAEGLALEVEHNRLADAVVDAQRKLLEFETTKLEMNGDTGTDAAI